MIYAHIKTQFFLIITTLDFLLITTQGTVFSCNNMSPAWLGVSAVHSHFEQYAHSVLDVFHLVTSDRSTSAQKSEGSIKV